MCTRWKRQTVDHDNEGFTVTDCCTSLQLGGLGEVYEEKVETSDLFHSYKL